MASPHTAARLVVDYLSPQYDIQCKESLQGSVATVNNEKAYNVMTIRRLTLCQGHHSHTAWGRQTGDSTKFGSTMPTRAQANTFLKNFCTAPKVLDITRQYTPESSLDPAPIMVIGAPGRRYYVCSSNEKLFPPNKQRMR